MLPKVRALFLLPLVFACASRAPPLSDDANPASPQITLYGVTFQAFRGADLAAAGRAAKVVYLRAGADFDADDALLRMPSRGGTLGTQPANQRAPGLEVRAPRVKGNLEGKRGLASGGVVLRSGNGLVGRSPSAHFDGAQGTASGEEPVQVTGPHYAVSAEGFAFDLHAEQFTFRRAVNSKFGAPR
jgi:lipopolysaccharide export system protein LptC